MFTLEDEMNSRIPEAIFCQLGEECLDELELESVSQSPWPGRAVSHRPSVSRLTAATGSPQATAWSRTPWCKGVPGILFALQAPGPGSLGCRLIEVLS